MDILEYERSQETKFHGHGNFPFNIYLCSIPLDFTVVHTHWHNDMEIVYIKKGMGTIAVNLCPFKVSQGDIVVIPPGQLHSIQQIPGHSMEYENIIFQLSILMAPKGDLCTTEFFHPLRQGKISFDSHYPAGSLHHSGRGMSGCHGRNLQKIPTWLPARYQGPTLYLFLSTSFLHSSSHAQTTK